MSTQLVIESLTSEQLKKDLPTIHVGDTVNVFFRIVEGDKERTQVFQGVVIARKGRGINQMMTVRKIVEEVGTERQFPIHSPMISKFEVVRRGDSRRAKLYYLRDRSGKSRRLRDRRRALGKLGTTAKAETKADAKA
ncbi:MAG: 50S ribosomal protein L19 [Phycisphaerales bacterium]|nr:50S ribosomal protein L19 [Phycisphaerales bacterium]MCK6478377.1 50S ribosomal protein L19 [Phycisphaerales bacterium]